MCFSLYGIMPYHIFEEIVENTRDLLTKISQTGTGIMAWMSKYIHTNNET